ncbi:alanine-tRNA ligase mitochondrial [Crotalus adamanteus]|uniref:Alanine--tRNA ligase n=1 Tax=Crotalus adamanteus TaxID=8729 RepID=A0AAW1CBP5_CROAD
MELELLCIHTHVTSQALPPPPPIPTVLPAAKMAATVKSCVRCFLRLPCNWHYSSFQSRSTASLSSAHVRQMFLQFFQERHGHQVVPSASVRPRNDPGLLFVNAGMNQFKPIFLGTADPQSELKRYRRIVNTQKCVRAGGKHNDLEDVGRDVYHHTFFEMLGNWSFGDYFKEEACKMAWELLTHVYEIPKDQLYVTYFEGDVSLGLTADEGCRDIWLALGVPPSHVLPFHLKDNFWEMGDTGPCGPCTEIHYDHIGGGRNAAALVNQGCPDVVEIWNLVFIQYNREANGSLRHLPQHHVDTGMGLERLMTVLQNKRSNYDTDLFTPILDAIHKGCGGPGYQGLVGETDPGGMNMAYRVVADHVRALSVCIADGIFPGMAGAELVLRHILRRAVRFSSEVLHAPPGFLASLVPVVVEILGDAYPELKRDPDQIMNIINENEAAFFSSLLQGRRVINRTLQKLNHSQVFPGEVAWSLYRNLGFPLDLIKLMLEEKGVQLDIATFDHLAQEHAEHNAKLQQQQQPQSPGKQLDVLSLAQLQERNVPITDDSPKYDYKLEQDGKYVFKPCQATVLALYRDQTLQEEISGKQHCGVLLNKTCFYAEQGGQASDQGYMLCDRQQDVLFPVESVQVFGGYVIHEVFVSETLKVGDQVQLFVDEAQRLASMRNHTATHLLNFALRQVLGDCTEQQGSSVTAEHLRFFVNTKVPIKTENLQEVESVVQEMIKRNETVYTRKAPLNQTSDVLGLRKLDTVYPDLVRIVSVGVPVEKVLAEGSKHAVNTSVELCCGVHLLQTGDVQDFTIISERQMAKGISHIVAVTGEQARQAQDIGQCLVTEVDSLATRVKVGGASVSEARRISKEVGHLTDRVDTTKMPQWQKRKLQASLKTLQQAANNAHRKMEIRLAAEKVQDLLTKYSNEPVIIDTIPAETPYILMKAVNQLCNKVPGASVMLFSSPVPGQVFCACQISKSSLSKASAADWALAVCTQMGGKAEGSGIVAKGMAKTDDVQMVLAAAQEYAKNVF